MKIGRSKILRIRVPAFMKGKMVLLNLGNFQGRWGMVCCLPPFEFGEAIFLNQYHRTVQSKGAVLLGLLPCGYPILDPNLPKARVLRIPLIADPLGRLQRVLGLQQGQPSSNRCQSFIFDPQGVIRYHLVHLLNWRGMAFLLDILKHCQELYPQHQTSCAGTNNVVVSLEKIPATRTRCLSHT